MLGLLIMTTVWLNEPSAQYHKTSGLAPSYLSPAEQARWEVLRSCDLLYRDCHRLYFLEEQRSQNDYPQEEINGERRQRFITFNLCKLTSHTTADLMFGAKAEFDAPTTVQFDRIADLAKRSLIHPRLWQAGVDMSWSGGAFLEASLWRGETYIEVNPPQEIYPQGKPNPDGQYERYIRYATDSVMSPDGKTVKERLLLKTIFDRGVIRRELYALDDKGNVKDEALPLDRWPAFQVSPRQPEERTGIDRNTIVYLANTVGRYTGISDYDGLIELQDQVNSKFSQPAKVIAQHGNPAVWAEQDLTRQDGNVHARDRYFTGGTQPPQYLAWDARLIEQFQDRAESIMAFCIAAEMSPVLLGIKQGATPDAARKVRLEATKSLSKAGRKTIVVEPAIALAIEIAQQLEQATPLLRSYPIDPVGVHFRDGLPVDGIDLANEASTWRSAGLMSVEDGVSMRIENPDAAELEVKRIADENAAKVPTVFGGPSLGAAEPGEVATPTNDKPDIPAQEAA